MELKLKLIENIFAGVSFSISDKFLVRLQIDEGLIQILKYNLLCTVSVLPFRYEDNFQS